MNNQAGIDDPFSLVVVNYGLLFLAKTRSDVDVWLGLKLE